MFDQIEDLDNIGPRSSSERKRILAGAVAHENTVHPLANIRMIESEDLAEHLQNETQNGRYRLLVSVGGHYLAVDVLQQQGRKSCVVLDAANDFRMYGVEDAFKSQGFQVMSASGLSADASDSNLQCDVHNCSMFALDHCVQLSTQSDDMHQTLRGKATEWDSFTWDCLPPNFLWNGQSLSRLNKYMQDHPERADEKMPNGLSMREYVRIGTTRDPVSGKDINSSIDVHVFKEAYKAYQKSEILRAMDNAIQKSSTTGLISSGKTEKMANLQRIRDAFAQSKDPEPLKSSYIAEFESAASVSRFMKAATSATVFRAEMTTIREKFQSKDTEKTVAGVPRKDGNSYTT